MHVFVTWLRDLTTKPLPGGVSAAALASAVGTGLLAKAARTSMRRQDLSEEDLTALQAVVDLASHTQPDLLGLVEADERAYRAVLDCRARGNGNLASGDTWFEAIDVPIRVAEACHLLLSRLPRTLDLCWPPVESDLQVALWLIEVGLRAGLAAAESNLRACPGHEKLVRLQSRIDALRQSLESER